MCTNNSIKMLTAKENEMLLTLFKDFSSDHNANTLAKKLDVTRRWALKMVKNLYKKGILHRRKYGKATFYKVNLEDQYTKNLIKTLLMGEAREKGNRWIHEFKDFYKHLEIAVIFGSAVRDYKKANDIDVLLVLKEREIKKVKELVKSKNELMYKPIHPIWQMPKDIERNTALPDPVIVNALHFGYVLHGYDKLINAVSKAQKAHGLFAVPKPEQRL